MKSSSDCILCRLHNDIHKIPKGEVAFIKFNTTHRGTFSWVTFNSKISRKGMKWIWAMMWTQRGTFFKDSTTSNPNTVSLPRGTWR
ncbi:hypothetical protein PRUPE_8G040800 [Prunus persica]|uniref:Uncharacterized protein n=1 Tax=Prunus persica TaxID=3760 RepID=A0A251MSS4_PRUPE|nr:hypothetical protein PRUPE_8G040800 [Prunus persica]